MAARSGSVDSIGTRRRLQRLGRAPPFSSLPRDVLRDVASSSLDRTLRTGAVLFHQGDAASAAYVMDRGAVRLSTSTLEGRSIVFRLAGPGGCFGLSSLLDAGPRSAEARALTDARLMVVPYPVLRAPMDRNPAVAVAFARYVASRLRNERERVGSFASNDTTTKLAAMLRELGESHGVVVPDGVLIDVPLRHEDLAGLVGTTRETVTRTMSALARRGFLQRVGSRYLVVGLSDLARGSGA